MLSDRATVVVIQKHVHDKLPHIRRLHIWSDCGRHFRSAKILTAALIDSAKVIQDGGRYVETDMSYHIESHGKCLCDGLFGLMQRTLDDIFSKYHVHDYRYD